MSDMSEARGMMPCDATLLLDYKALGSCIHRCLQPTHVWEIVNGQRFAIHVCRHCERTWLTQSDAD